MIGGQLTEPNRCADHAINRGLREIIRPLRDGGFGDFQGFGQIPLAVSKQGDGV